MSVLHDTYENKKEAVAFSLKSKRILVPLINRVKTTRMIAQHGLFTFCFSHGNDHDQLLEEYLKLPNPGCRNRLVIPSEMKLDVLRHLATMGITAATLFPGADGVAQTILHRLHWL